MGNKDYPIPQQYREQLDVCGFYLEHIKPIKPVLDAEQATRIFRRFARSNEERWQDYDIRRYAYWVSLPVPAVMPMVIMPSCRC